MLYKQLALHLLLMTSVFVTKNIAQDCESCLGDWVPDFCLSEESSNYHIASHNFNIYIGKQILLTDDFVINSSITFEGCDIRVSTPRQNATKTVAITYVSANDWILGQTQFSFIDCVVTACHDKTLAGFFLAVGNPFDDPANLDVVIDGCWFFEGIHLLHANAMNLKLSSLQKRRFLEIFTTMTSNRRWCY